MTSIFINGSELVKSIYGKEIEKFIVDKNIK